MTTLAQPPVAGGVSGLVRDVRVLSQRDFRQVFTPGALFGTIGLPLLFFCMFYATLQRLLDGRGIDFGMFVTPTVVVQAVMFVAIASAGTLSADRASGLLTRLRTMPISNAAVAANRLFVVSVEAAMATVAVVVLGVVAGFRFTAGPLAAIGFLLVAVLFAAALTAATATVGLTMRNPGAMAAVLNMPYLPLLVVSTGFVPAEQFPGWLQPIVHGSPVSAVVDALRALSSGSPTFGALWPAVAWCAGLIALFGWTASRAFRRMTP